MLSLTRISLKNRALIALITICAAVFGVIGTSSLKQELFPEFELPQAFISAQYEGATPQAVESEVTAPLEAALTGVAEVESMQSTSAAGSSQIVVETDYGTDSDDVVRSLQRAVSQAQGQLPDGVEPTVFAGGLADFPVMMLTVTGGEDVESLAADMEDIAVPELQDVEGVRSVEVTGDRPMQVSITVREDDLEDEGVSIEALSGLLQANGIPSAPGQLRTSEGSAPVQVGTRLESVEQIRSLVLAGADGPVRVDDVADVELTQEPQTSVSRTDGKDALTVQIMKKPDGNTVEISHGVTATLDEVADTMGAGVEFTTVFDQAPFVEQSIEDLLVEGLLGLGFAVLVILVFLLSARATVITAISIPVSLLITMIGLWVSGYTLNMLTLGALTISVGRVVDDSIVVIEAIRRRHAMGGDKLTNIRAAVAEVAGAITASTLTTVAVFLPVAFVGGQAGELFRPFALTASLALLASLFVALTIVPVLAYWFLSRRGKQTRLSKEQKRHWKSERTALTREWRKERKEARSRRIDPAHPSGRRSTAELPVVGAGTELGAAGGRRVDRGVAEAGSGGTGPGASATGGSAASGPAMSASGPGGSGTSDIDELEAMHSPVTRLQRTYVPVVGWTTRHPVVTLAAALVVFIGTMAMTPLLKTELFGDTGEAVVQMTQEFGADVYLDEASEEARQVEDVLAERPEVVSSLVSITGGGDAMMMGGGGGGLSGTYVANLGEDVDIPAFAESLQEELDALGTSGEIEVLTAGTMPGGSTIDVTLTSNDTAALEEGADSLGAELGELGGVQSVSDDLTAVQPVVEVRVDREEAAEYGLTESGVGQVVSRAMRGQQLGQVIIDDVGHSVLLFDGSVEDLDDLRGLELDGMETVDAPAPPLDPTPGEQAPGGPGGEQGGEGGPGGGLGDGQGAAPGPGTMQQPATVELDEIAEVEEVTTAPTITRVDGLRAVTVSATPGSDDLGTVSAEIQEAVDAHELPDGVRAEIGGAAAEQQEAFTQMGIAMLAAILLVFVIMVATFRSLIQPFILLVSIPFAATGSVGLLLLTDTPLGMTALIGLLMLIGVVVTNAIVLIDLINQFRERGVDLRTAIVQGARLRYRPILMTAAATIFALTPMALGVTGGSVFISQPLAIVVIGGLISSTVLTLILVPVLYQLVEGFKERRAEKREIADITRDQAVAWQPAGASGAEADARGAGVSGSAAPGAGADAPDAGGAAGEHGKH
ncbi:efflux RND transporter permease subunit [Brevibacterium album]|uniref:efflux RND transporter permease subunit n=1 Tax=Brevibacterium album TaxID=417948 RepID=UPI0003FEADE9|nr:efflux RND transporter permease subunit [Brevibacterium album]